MYSILASKKNAQTIRVNMLPSYLHLSDEPTFNMSQYDIGLYNYQIQLFEKNRPYYLSDLEDKEETDEGEDTPTDETTDEAGGDTDNETGNESDETNENNNDSNETITGDGENTETTDNTDGNETDDTNENQEEGNSSDETPETYSVRVYVQGIKPDNKVFRYEAGYYGNIVYLPEKEQITNVPGIVKCEVIVIKDNLRKTSELFYINVQKALIQDAYKVSKNEVVKLANEEEAEYIEPEEQQDVNEGEDESVTTNP